MCNLKVGGGGSWGMTLLQAAVRSLWEERQAACPGSVTPTCSSIREELAAHEGDTGAGIYVFVFLLNSGQRRIYQF